jgi:dihydrofolate synthase/folylpolyglutamate synthase
MPAGAALRARGAFQRANFALARAAAEAYLQDAGITVREQAVADAACSTEVPGRLQLLSREPPTVLDGAHNPHAIAALIESLPEVLDACPPAPVALVLGVLEDKDAAAMLAALLAHVERAWFTAPPSARALSPAALQSLARQLGFDAVSCEPQPSRALEQAREWASQHAGAVLATGSVYLVGDLLGALERDGAAHGETIARSSAR